MPDKSSRRFSFEHYIKRKGKHTASHTVVGELLWGSARSRNITVISLACCERKGDQNSAYLSLRVEAVEGQDVGALHKTSSDNQPTVPRILPLYRRRSRNPNCLIPQDCALRVRVSLS